MQMRAHGGQGRCRPCRLCQQRAAGAQHMCFSLNEPASAARTG